MRKQKIIPYQPYLKEYARRLRKKSTKSEAILWQHLRKKQILGYDFHRQKPLDNYIVDFYCGELQLAIELDGITHDYKIKDDNLRQQRLESLGVHFLRFTDSDVLDNLQGVYLQIEEWIKEHG